MFSTSGLFRPLRNLYLSRSRKPFAFALLVFRLVGNVTRLCVQSCTTAIRNGDGGSEALCAPVEPSVRYVGQAEAVPAVCGRGKPWVVLVQSLPLRGVLSPHLDYFTLKNVGYSGNRTPPDFNMRRLLKTVEFWALFFARRGHFFRFSNLFGSLRIFRYGSLNFFF